MLTGIANHICHPAYLFCYGRAVNHGVGDRIVAFVTVTLMDIGQDVRRAGLIVARQAGSGSFGQETVVVIFLDMVKEVVAMAGGATASMGRHADCLAIGRPQSAV